MEIEVTRVYKMDESFPPVLKEVEKTIDIDDIVSYEESLYFNNMTEVSLASEGSIIINKKYSQFKEILYEARQKQRFGIED